MTSLDPDPIPPELRDTQAVAIAHIRPDGTLLAANAGFLRLIPGDEYGATRHNVAALFLLPQLGELTTLEPGKEGVIYAGPLTLGTYQSSTRTLNGRLERHGRELRLVAEHDVERIESFQRSVSSLTLALADAQRKLVRANQELERRVDERTEALRQSDDRLRIAKAAAGIGVWEWDVATRNVAWSPELEALYGVAPGAFEGTGETWLNLVHPDDRASVEAAMQGMPEQRGLVEIDFRIRHASGKPCWLALRCQPEFDSGGSLKRIVGVSFDVSARKRLQIELDDYREHLELLVAERTAGLETAEANARLILESSADGLYGIDALGRVTFINPAASRMLGYATDEVLGRSMHALIHHSRNDGSPYPELACNIHANLRPDMDHRVEHEVYWRADGSPIPVTQAVHSMVRNGQVVGAVVSFTDVSTRRAAEQARENALAEAERLVRVRQEFLANMSHEIRTPLNGILGLANLGCRADDEQRARQYFGRIVEAGKLLLGIVNDILDFSKIEAGKLTLEALPLDPAELLEQAAQMMRERAHAKGIELAVAAAPDLPRGCLGDPLRISQILVNLLSNAVKFTESGSVALDARRDGERLVFRVSDSGIGMTRNEIARLFMPFEQADGSTTRRFGGTGLGLAITQQLTELMGGEIRVQSEPGKGSVFEVWLPLLPATPPAARAPDPPAARAAPVGPPLAGIAVLVVEDTEVNQIVLQEILNRAGARVSIVGDGRQALEQIAQHGSRAFDLVLMDIQMPIMDGYEATRRIREIAPELPIVGQTAHAMAEERARCLAAGMVDHLAKPIDTARLLATVLSHARREDAPALAATSSDGRKPQGGEPDSLRIDWERLKSHFGANPALIEKLAAALLHSHRDTPAALRNAARARDYGVLVFLSHTLRGVVGNLMLPQVLQLSSELEHAARGQDPRTLRLAEELAPVIDSLLAQAVNYLGAEDPNTKRSPDRRPDDSSMFRAGTPGRATGARGTIQGQEKIRSAADIMKTAKQEPGRDSGRQGSGPAQPPQFPIVGIGASAGGLDALDQFLGSVPPGSGMAFVVIQHLDPDHTGMLPELLQRATRMTVVQARSRTRVRPDHVYVIPPNKDMSIRHGTLHLLDPAAPRGLRLPIDFFFRALADDQLDRSIGVILSGMGSDGTLGLAAIKERGGLALVQEPGSARFDAMPRSAIDAGLADIVAVPGALPQRIADYVAPGTHADAAADSAEPAAGQGESGLDKVVALLRARTGHDFSLYKSSTLYRRIERRMGIHQLSRIADYVRTLGESPQELDLLFKELLIGVTRFFRDRETWEHIQEHELPALLADHPAGKALRAWVVGCSTGEEAYSLAIVFREALERIRPAARFSLQIFATDLDGDGIERARQARYPANIAADVSAERLARFFVEEDGGYRVAREIREMVVFAPQNVIMDPPFTRLDILSCRNLLIYLSAELQKKLLPLFHYSLNPGGILILGSAESLGGFTDLFEASAAKLRVFRRSAHPARAAAVDFPSRGHSVAAEAGQVQQAAAPADLQAHADRLLLQHFAPAAVLVNSDGDIVYISGRTGKYLEPAAGKANWNIHAMAREGLRGELALALPDAFRSAEPVHRRGMVVGGNGSAQSFDLAVMAIDEPGPLRGMALLVFSDTPAAVPETGSVRTRGAASRSRIAELESALQQARNEIRGVREAMQASQEERKSANEELQSTNEELQSANEELTTSKEEMQSLNEELQTVNAELQSKLDELLAANNDMKNLLNSTDIATIFLDSALRVRRFTNQATRLFKLIVGDVGRPLSDIVTALDYPQLQQDVQEVLHTLVYCEKQIATRDERWFQVRIMPYRTLANVIDGVVITFSDISEAKRLEAQLREALGQPCPVRKDRQ